jgi:protein-tyrosine-phosphatase
MAEALFKYLLKTNGFQGWIVESAGTWANEGQPAFPQTQEVMSDLGLDISQHRSRIVTRNMLRQFDLILTMESGHKEALEIEFPEITPRLYLLSEMIDEQQDVADPIGGQITDFRHTAARIHRILTQGFDRIVQLARNPDPLEIPPWEIA